MISWFAEIEYEDEEDDREEPTFQGPSWFGSVEHEPNNVPIKREGTMLGKVLLQDHPRNTAGVILPNLRMLETVHMKCN